MDRRLGPNQARFWLDWAEKPSPAMPLHLWHRHSCLWLAILVWHSRPRLWSFD